MGVYQERKGHAATAAPSVLAAGGGSTAFSSTRLQKIGERKFKWKKCHNGEREFDATKKTYIDE